jgi:hypothetical protein
MMKKRVLFLCTANSDRDQIRKTVENYLGNVERDFTTDLKDEGKIK